MSHSTDHIWRRVLSNLFNTFKVMSQSAHDPIWRRVLSNIFNTFKTMPQSTHTPGMDLEFALEFAWNRAKKNSFFYSDSTWNDLEWQIIWVWFFYLEWGGNLPVFLPNSYHSTWIWAECVGEGKVLFNTMVFRSVYPASEIKSWNSSR